MSSNLSTVKPYKLLEYFPKSAGWKGCHVHSKQINVAQEALCEYCKLLEKAPVPKDLVTFVKPPTQEANFSIKRRLCTFNHVHAFVIYQGLIWAKKRDDLEGDWKPVKFDGISPLELHADGANLVVLDQQRVVHYKKILREHRGEELWSLDNIPPDCLEKDSSISPYYAVDKIFKNNWKPAWFTLPVLSDIVNFFDGKTIKIAQDILAWGISHRGTYNNCYEDAEGILHPVNTGVTTLYALMKSGKDFLKLDPWSLPKADLSFCVHDTADATFEAFNMSPSASTLMLLGYESKANAKGGTTKTLIVKTRLVDIDTEGLNPGIKYTYFKERTKGEEIRVILLGTWESHALPRDIRCTGEITLLQTGEGNLAREMRVEALGDEDQLGYYHKMLYEKEWEFSPYESEDNPQAVLKPFNFDEDVPFTSTVAHYRSSQFMSFRLIKPIPRPLRVEMRDFGRYSDNATLLFIYPNGQIEQLTLHRKKTFANVIGIKTVTYDLINFAEKIEGSNLEWLFPRFDKRCERVTVRDHGSSLTIAGLFFYIEFAKI